MSKVKSGKKVMKTLSIMKAKHLELTKEQKTKLSSVLYNSVQGKKLFKALLSEMKKGNIEPKINTEKMCYTSKREMIFAFLGLMNLLKIGKIYQETVGSRYIKVQKFIVNFLGIAKDVKRHTHLISEDGKIQEHRYADFELVK